MSSCWRRYITFRRTLGTWYTFKDASNLRLCSIQQIIYLHSWLYWLSFSTPSSYVRTAFNPLFPVTTGIFIKLFSFIYSALARSCPKGVLIVKLYQTLGTTLTFYKLLRLNSNPLHQTLSYKIQNRYKVSLEFKYFFPCTGSSEIIFLHIITEPRTGRSTFKSVHHLSLWALKFFLLLYLCKRGGAKKDGKLIFTDM